MDQDAIATFKAYYLRRTFRKLIHKNVGESSIKQFWKKYNIRDAMDNISESWRELKSTTMIERDVGDGTWWNIFTTQSVGDLSKSP
jgi:hypothetical protein